MALSVRTNKTTYPGCNTLAKNPTELDLKPTIEQLGKDLQCVHSIAGSSGTIIGGELLCSPTVAELQNEFNEAECPTVVCNDIITGAVNCPGHGFGAIKEGDAKLQEKVGGNWVTRATVSWSDSLVVAAAALTGEEYRIYNYCGNSDVGAILPEP